MTTQPDRPRAERAATGIRGLDDVLAGGFPARRLYLVEGDPGAGKTTLAMQFLRHAVSLGEAVLYVTLSESREELEAAAESHGWSLDGVHICEVIPAEGDLEPDSQLSMFHPSEVELGQTTRAVIAEIERLKPRRVVIDSLSELRLLAQSSLRYRRQVLAFKQFFLGRDCTVLMLDDRTSEGPDRQLQSIAHGVLVLEHLSPEYGAERRRLRLTKLRASTFRGGFHDFTIRKGGLVVFPRLVASEHGSPFRAEQIGSGITSLDHLLGGGIDRGTSTLLIGPVGCGKSTLAALYASQAARRGENAAVFAFDEGLATLLRRSEGLGLGLAEQVADGRVTLQQVDPAELSPGELAHDIRRAVEERGATVVVIDSLNGYLNAMPEERFLVAQLHEVLTYLGQRGVATILVVGQSGLMGSAMTAPVDASYLADTVILLRFYEAFGEIRRAISVVKRRSGGHEPTIRPLILGDGTIRVGEPLREFQGVLTGVPTVVDPGRGRADG